MMTLIRSHLRISKCSFRLLAVLASAILPNCALAQTTPSELTDISFEDLLNVTVTDKSRAKTDERWTINYTYKRSKVAGYKNGTNELSFEDVLFSPGEVRTAQNYPVVPTFITQSVHAASATYAVTSSTSLMLVVPYVSQSTEHISIVPGFSEFVLSTDGIGDITLNAGYKKNLNADGSVTANIGIRFPTGSIDKMGDTPRNGAGTLERLPYTMQLGSGTYDISASFGHNRSFNSLTVHANINAIIRTGLNDNAYRLGNSYGLVISSRYTKHYWLQPGIRFSLRHTGNIVGQDESLLVPGAFPFPASITDPNNYGGENATTAISLTACTNIRCRLSLVAEVSTPLYQNLNGIQPKQRRIFSIAAIAHF